MAAFAGAKDGPKDEPPPSVDDPSDQPADPHGLSTYVLALTSAGERRSRGALLAAAVLLNDGETAEGLLVGRHQAHDAVAVLTADRVIVVNDRPYGPDHQSVSRAAITAVKGWVDANLATIRISSAAGDVVLGGIREVESAQRFEAALRAG